MMIRPLFAEYRSLSVLDAGRNVLFRFVASLTGERNLLFRPWFATLRGRNAAFRPLFSAGRRAGDRKLRVGWALLQFVRPAAGYHRFASIRFLPASFKWRQGRVNQEADKSIRAPFETRSSQHPILQASGQWVSMGLDRATLHAPNPIRDRVSGVEAERDLDCLTHPLTTKPTYGRA